MGFKIPYDTWEPAYFDVCESYLQLRRSTAVLFNTSVSIFALILRHLRIEIKNLVVVVKGFR